MAGRAVWLRSLAIASLLAWMAASVAATDVEQPRPADVCLAIASGALPAAAWGAVTTAIEDVVRSRPELFPEPTIVIRPASDEAAAVPAAGHRLAIRAGHAPADQLAAPSDDCARDGRQWTARLSRGFLVAGAERMLGQAPTTPGIASSIHLEWYPRESRVRTRLEFAGPLDIPSGQCWIDDHLAVDPGTRRAVTRAERGLHTSPFAEGACGRFFDHLTRGGAGEQAVTLLPNEVELATGARLRFEVVEVSVEDDAVVMAGSLGG